MAAGMPAEAHHGAGRDRPASSERGRGARRAGRRPVGDGHRRGSRTTSRATTRRMSISGAPSARHAGQARPPLRRGGPAHRHRPGRAALHGRLVGRPQGDRAGRRARRHDPTFHSARFMEDPLAVQCKLDGNPLHEEQLEIVRMLGEVLRAQHGDRRGARPRRSSTSARSSRATSRPSSSSRDCTEVPVAATLQDGRHVAPPAIRSTRPTTRPSRAW